VLGLRDRLVRRGDYIWGSFVKPESVDGYIVGVNPGDRDDILGRFYFSGVSVDDAVGSARSGFAAWSLLPVHHRAAIVNRFADVMKERRAILTALISRETGKPLWESQMEVQSAVVAVRDLVSAALDDGDSDYPAEAFARSERRPHGVVAIETPFVFPVLFAAVNTAASLLAGNAVVLKPSKFTPGVGQGLAEVWDRCRLPRGVFNMVQGSGVTTGRQLATHPGVDAVMFCGSHATAETLREEVNAVRTRPMLVQSGGKGAILVLRTADVERAAYDTLVSAFATCGQRHNSAARVFVHRSVLDQFRETLVARVRGLKIGYGMDPDVFMGPMISDTHRRRYHAYLGELAADGARVLVEGGPFEAERRGYYVRPGIVELEDGFMDNEPPGPVLQMYAVGSVEEAVERYNSMSFRLTAGVFGASDSEGVSFAMRYLRTGTIHVNRGTIGTSFELASVGQGKSSSGVPTGKGLLRFLTSPTATVVDTRPFTEDRLVPGVAWPISA